MTSKEYDINEGNHRIVLKINLRKIEKKLWLFNLLLSIHLRFIFLSIEQTFNECTQIFKALHFSLGF